MTACTLLTLFVLALSPADASGAAEPPHAFADIGAHYETIRTELLHDRIDGVAEPARAIARTARALRAAPSADRAGVAETDLEALDEFLALVAERADRLAATKDVTSMRAALGELTKPLVRWGELVVGEKPAVAYCSMERKAWLQERGELGNPYGGQRMPRCGRFVEW